MRTTNFKKDNGDDLGIVLIDRDYLIDVYPQLPYGSKLFSWGSNAYGQIGDNTIQSRSTPRQEFTSSANWKQFDRGQHTAAIKTDGTLWCWGNNYNGQVGDNTIIIRSTPRQEFTSSTNWKQVSAGGYHTAAIKTDGTLWCWGLNSYGQIGDNTQGAGGSQSRSTPRQVGTATNWKQVDCGFYTNTAIKTDGTLWCWGSNGNGILGNNTLVTRSTPIQEFTLSANWKQVSCGLDHTTAVKTDGTLWCWGSNGNGQIGDNTQGAGGSQSRSTPRQEFTSSTNWKRVYSGGSISIALKTDGTLWSWGLNIFGQIGDNTIASRSTPRQEFTSSTNWVQISSSSGIQAPPFVG